MDGADPPSDIYANPLSGYSQPGNMVNTRSVLECILVKIESLCDFISL